MYKRGKKNIYKFLYKKKKEKSTLKNNLKRERFPVMKKEKENLSLDKVKCGG